MINLAKTTLTAPQKEEICDLFVNNISDFDVFIKVLESDANVTLYGQTNISLLTLYFQISRVFRNNLALVSNVISTNLTSFITKRTSVTYPAFVGTLTRAQCLAYVQANCFGTNDSYDYGAYDNVTKFTDLIFDNIQKLFPQNATISLMRADEAAYTAEIQSILIENKDFDLLTGNIDDLEFNSSAQADDVKAQMKKIQNVYRVSTTPGAANTLLKHNLTSVENIYYKGKVQLEALFSDELSTEEIDNIYEIAAGRYATALITFANTNNLLTSCNPAAIYSYPDDEDTNTKLGGNVQVSNIREMFGDTNYYNWNYNRTIFSPAAYLADLLAFLSQRCASSTEYDLKELLDQRRADISKINLNEMNTTTLLPYIDLACEIFEEAIIKKEYPAVVFSDDIYQSTLPANELMAEPEHIVETIVEDSTITAYDVICDKLYPIYASFNLWLTETRSYLSKIGVERYKIMDDTSNAGTAITAYLKQMSAEFFKLTDLEYDVVIGSDNYTMAERNTGWSSDVNKGSIMVEMPLELFLEDTGLTSNDALDIAHASYIGIGLYNNVSPQYIPEELIINNNEKGLGGADAETTVVVRGYDSGFDRANRFIRLLKRTDWEVWELNLLIECDRVSQYKRLDANTLYNLMLFKQQQDLLDLSVEELLCFYQDSVNCDKILENGVSIPTLYDNLFLRKALCNPIGENLLSIKEGNIIEGFTDEEKKTTASALGISLDTFEELSTDYALGDSMGLLDYLFKNAKLLKWLDVSLTELKQYYLFLEYDVSNQYGINYKKLQDFISTVKSLKTKGLSIDYCNYLLDKEEYIPNADIGMGLNEISDFVQDIETIVNESSEMSSGAAGELDSEIISKLAMFFGVSYGIISEYVTKEITCELFAPDAHYNTLLELFKDESVYHGNNVQSSQIYISTPMKALGMIYKTVILIDKNKITEEDFLLMTSEDNVNTFAINWYDNGFTVDELLFAFDIFKLNTDWAKENTACENTLLNIIATSESVNEFISELSELRNWAETDLGTVLNEYSVDTLSVFTNPVTCVKMLQNIDSLMSYKQLINQPLSYVLELRERGTLAEEKVKSFKVKAAVKAFYDNNTLINEILPDLQEPIREAKCNALASYLITREAKQEIPLYANRADLYAYYLVDSEMCADMKTSRIVLATNSVQLFVQRALLHLEQGIVIDEEQDDGWKQWEWMQKYRLWEANRKVFIYPENWIEPELRDDKTSFFKELEDELGQNDITAEYVESVYENYLLKLNEVSNLLVCGLYREKHEDSKIDKLHVIGRTRTSPYSFYYRYVDLAAGGAWSPWEKIDAEIQGDMVVPYFYNGKLHLFWLSTSIKKSFNPDNVPKEDETIAEPVLFTEVQLCWIIRKSGKWGNVNCSVKRHVEFGHKPDNFYSFRALYDNELNELVFKIYTYTGLTENHSYYLNTAVMKFNGNVYFAMSVMNDFVESSSIKYDNNISISPKDSSCVLYYNFSTNPTDEVYYRILSEMDFLSRPVPVYVKDLSTTHLEITQAYLYNNRYYMIDEQIGNGSKAVIAYVGYDDSSSEQLLSTTVNGPNLAIMLHQYWDSKDCLEKCHYENPFFYQDEERVYYVKPNTVDDEPRFIFKPFYHPYANSFVEKLMRSGLTGLLCRETQDLSCNTVTDKYPLENGMYDKTDLTEIVDFDYSSPYSVYNWELFFHIPLYIACKLTQEQKFEDAMNWFHAIFNPMSRATQVDDKMNFWITKPFAEITPDDTINQRIDKLLENINDSSIELNNWLNNPYNPHMVARTRIVAFQRAVVMKYLDNIITWADNLFRQNTMEYNNVATLLYTVANEILGKKPFAFPVAEEYNNPAPYSYNYMLEHPEGFDWFPTFDNSIIYRYRPIRRNRFIVSPEILNYQQQASVSNNQKGGSSSQPSSQIESTINEDDPDNMINGYFVQGHFCQLPVCNNLKSESIPRIDVRYFCIPPNETLLGYWDTVADRLYKLRHCMNIEGVVQEVSLFEAPIDPGLLVKAAAAGMTIAEAMSQMSLSQPYYRFKSVVQKAIEFTSDVKSLGEKLLSAIEKRDAETLSLLRNTHEINIQQASLSVRKYQIEEAKASMASINESINTAEFRRNYYYNQKFMNNSEKQSQDLMEKAKKLHNTVAAGCALSALFSAIPSFMVGIAGAMGSPVGDASYGGENLKGSYDSIMNGLSSLAGIMEREASRLNVQASYERRRDDWRLQSKLAGKEILQLQKQLSAAEIRLSINEKELDNLKLQIEQGKEVKEYYERKYTNEALYNWMITQVKNVYYQAYKLAYDMARKAERCYNAELGIYDNSTNFIRFDNWDSLNQGLLSGDKLMYDIRRMESDYMDKNKRTAELKKHVSIAEFFPDKLMTLIYDKETQFSVSELLFDMDYPGHYKRRIKSVSLTVLATGQKNVNLSCMLTLQNAKIRKSSECSIGYAESSQSSDSRFEYQNAINEIIFASSAMDDTGTFEINFGDERYLPFENSGAISEWKIEFPAVCNQVDLSAISDVIIHINYTALYDGALRIAAENYVNDNIPAGALIVSPVRDFPNEWNQMNDLSSMVFEVKKEMYPMYFKEISTVKMSSLSVIIVSKEYVDVSENVSVTLNNADNSSSLVVILNQRQQFGDAFVYGGSLQLSEGGEVPCTGNWELVLSSTNLTSKVDVIDLLLGFVLVD